jgi:hypothetical protein
MYYVLPAPIYLVSALHSVILALVVVAWGMPELQDVAHGS